MRTTDRRKLVGRVPTGIDRSLDDVTFRLLEQIYVDRQVRYSKVVKALAGIEQTIHTGKRFDKSGTEELLRKFRDYSGEIEQDSGRIRVINHFFVGSILNLVEQQGFFSKREFMQWARARFGRGHTDQTLLNSRYIADLGEIAFKYADYGVKPVLELHYMFNTFLKQQIDAVGETATKKPTPEDRRKFIGAFDTRLQDFVTIYSGYDDRSRQLTMRTAMDAAITYYRLIEVAGISPTVVTKDHAIMIALYKGFSLENRDAIIVKDYLNKETSTDDERALKFDRWVANRMSDAPEQLSEIGAKLYPDRLIALLSRFAKIPNRGSSHLNKEIEELAKESSLTKATVHEANQVVAYVANKLRISLFDSENAYEECVERLRQIDEARSPR